MFKHATLTPKFAIILMLIVCTVVFAACGGNSNSTGSGSGDNAAAASSDNSAPAVPTMPIPKENFKAHAENQITQTISVSSTQPASQTQAATTTTTTTSASADDLARGSRSYAKNKCADCHGDKGEVVAGKTTKAIGGTTLAEDQFDQFLRTGGGLGDTHIFGPSAISPGGMQALYEYVKSLPGK